MHYSYRNKILWLLTNALVSTELTFKCCSMRKQQLIPKIPSLTLSLLEKHPSSFSLGRKIHGNNRKWQNTIWENMLRANQCAVEWQRVYTASCIIWCSRTMLGLALLRRWGRRLLFRCVLMRHHEGMLRMEISGRLATYSTALGEITKTVNFVNLRYHPLLRTPLKGKD